MKYIRTKDGRILGYDYVKSVPIEFKVKQGFTKEQVLQELEEKSDVARVADTIEELCDYFDYHDKILKHFLVENNPYITNLIKTKDKKFANKDKIKAGIYGAIWTDRGLIYVAKMNEKGELELL